MEEIFKIAEALGEAIHDSLCYENYCYYKEKLEEDEELKNKIISFKRDQFNMEIKRKQDVFIDEDAELSFNNNYCEIMFNEIGLGFMKNEQEVIKLLSQVFECISEKAAVDIGYLE